MTTTPPKSLDDLVTELVDAAFSVMHHDCDPNDPEDLAAVYEHEELTRQYREILFRYVRKRPRKRRAP